ncbi:alpha/beta hydrolase [bacterium]|nr:alpha/beta hydrolase [bacterium]
MEEAVPEQAAPLPRRLRRIAFLIMTTLITFLLLVVAGLLLFQHGMIYFPRPYERSYRMGFPPNMIELEFATTSGKQTAFYQPPKGDPSAPPQHLWIMIGGNASLALDWADLIVDVDDDETGFLLVDYPGYGISEGKASGKKMLEATEGAFDALASRLQMSPEQLGQDVSHVGHSMGCASVLQFAARHPARRIILISPFTSLADMARLTVGWPLCYTLLDRYDNRARLDELAERVDPPDVHIFHGTQDNIVPFRMGKELADRHPSMIKFHRVQGGDHNWVIEMSRKKILRLMSNE